MTGERSVSRGPGNQGAGFVPERSGRGSPVEESVGTRDFTGVGSGVVGLGLGLDAMGLEGGDGVDEQASADLGQPIVEGLGVVRIENGCG